MTGSSGSREITGGRYAQLRAALHEPYSLIISELSDSSRPRASRIRSPGADGAVHRVSVTLRGRPIHGLCRSRSERVVEASPEGRRSFGR
jgi:hypothetical protein